MYASASIVILLCAKILCNAHINTIGKANQYNPVKRATSVDVDPTDPSAVALENLPTTATSAILNNTCSRCGKISGMLNRKMFLYNGPSVIVMPLVQLEIVPDMINFLLSDASI